MSLGAKFQNDPFIRSIVSSKNVKRTFFWPEPLPDDFSKILFHGDILNNGIVFSFMVVGPVVYEE